jgi:hypothetical protein
VAEWIFACLEMAMMVREPHPRPINGRNGMKRACATPLAIAAFVGWLMPAHAAPPTAAPSPGYDARLQEQRAASARVFEPVAPLTRPVTPRRAKRIPVH